MSSKDCIILLAAFKKDATVKVKMFSSLKFDGLSFCLVHQCQNGRTIAAVITNDTKQDLKIVILPKAMVPNLICPSKQKKENSRTPL